MYILLAGAVLLTASFVNMLYTALHVYAYAMAVFVHLLMLCALQYRQINLCKQACSSRDTSQALLQHE